MSFERPASDDDPDDHGDQPYEPGNSLIDRERIGFFSVSYSEQWLGGLQIRAQGAAGEVDIMLDRQQGYMLATGLLRWFAGTVRGWARRPLANFGMCRECGGTGFRVTFNDEA